MDTVCLLDSHLLIDFHSYDSGDFLSLSSRGMSPDTDADLLMTPAQARQLVSHIQNLLDEYGI